MDGQAKLRSVPGYRRAAVAQTALRGHKKQLLHLSGASSVSGFQTLTKEEQSMALYKLKAKGVTIKQLQAATGLSYYTIQKE